MKSLGIVLLALLLAGCDRPKDTQLRLEASRQLQRDIDTSPLRENCEHIARGREWLTSHTLQRLEKNHCQNVLRSASEADLVQAAIHTTTIPVVCGAIQGRSFTGGLLTRRFIYSYDEKALLIRPESEQDKSRFEDRKTLQQLQENFERQWAKYCQ